MATAIPPKAAEVRTRKLVLQKLWGGKAGTGAGTSLSFALDG